MLSRLGRSSAVAAAFAVVALCTLTATTGHAMPATVDYQCQPALPAGDSISIDFNSGGKSITVQFPNGQSVRMPAQRSGSGFRYAGENVMIYGKGQTTITLEVAGQPSRQCVTSR